MKHIVLIHINAVDLDLLLQLIETFVFFCSSNDIEFGLKGFSTTKTSRVPNFFDETTKC